MAADPLVGKVLADRFEILARIGEGGTGVVYKAKQVTVDRDVAVKVLGAHVSTDPQWVKRFHNEARAAAKLRSPHTVGLIDFGQTKEGLLFIAMELLSGCALRDEIDKVGKLSVDRALNITAQGCTSVQEAHSQGIIHRDIKPDNLYLCDNQGVADYVKVLDFSVAKLDDPNSQQTRAGVVFGTPCYMSPEQGRGAQLGPGSDIYAFGIVLYEMVSGKPPFDSKIPTEVVMMHLRDKPAPLQGVPGPVVTIVNKALDKDPTKRQRSCEQMAQECMEALGQLYPGRGTPSGRQQQISSQPAMQAPPPASGGGGYASGGGAPPMAAGGGGGYGGSSGGGGPVVAHSGGAQRGAVEQHTMMADAGQLSGGGGRPPPNVGNAYGAPPPGPAQSPSLSGGGGHQGTMMLPDSAGVVAFAAAQAAQARAQAGQVQAEPVKPAGPLFWTAWVVLGIGIGLAVHFIQVSQQINATPAVVSGKK